MQEIPAGEFPRRLSGRCGSGFAGLVFRSDGSGMKRWGVNILVSGCSSCWDLRVSGVTRWAVERRGGHRPQQQRLQLRGSGRSMNRSMKDLPAIESTRASVSGRWPTRVYRPETWVPPVHRHGYHLGHEAKEMRHARDPLQVGITQERQFQDRFLLAESGYGAAIFPCD